MFLCLFCGTLFINWKKKVIVDTVIGQGDRVDEICSFLMACLGEGENK